MIPLVLCSLISLTFILERSFYLRRRNIIDARLAAAIDALQIGGNLTQIEQIVVASNTTLSRLVRTCLEHAMWPKTENVEAMQTKARTEIVELERGLVVLEISTGISPLMGLLGTVSGLISVFAGVANAGGSMEGLMIAKGIAEGLNCTVMGLIVAIPCLAAHSYYSKKIENLMAEVESLCMDFLVKIYLQVGE